MLAVNPDVAGGEFPYPGPQAPSASPAPSAPSAGQAPAGPAPAPPGSISFGGSTPDYANLITSDPTYVAAQGAAGAAQQGADAQRRAAVRDAFVKYGGKMPTGWNDTYGDIDQATKDAAAGNQFSTIASLGRNYAQSVEQFKRALAARGALQSGDLNYGQDQLDTGYGQGQYDAANQFMGQYNGALSNYAGVLGQNARDMGAGIQGAEQNVYSNPAYRPVALTSADYDASSSAQYGTAIYKGADGTLYTSDGTPYRPAITSAGPNAAPAPAAPGAYSPPGFSGFDANGNWIGMTV